MKIWEKVYGPRHSRHSCLERNTSCLHSGWVIILSSVNCTKQDAKKLLEVVLEDEADWPAVIQVPRAIETQGETEPSAVVTPTTGRGLPSYFSTLLSSVMTITICRDHEPTNGLLRLLDQTTWAYIVRYRIVARMPWRNLSCFKSVWWLPYVLICQGLLSHLVGKLRSSMRNTQRRRG